MKLVKLLNQNIFMMKKISNSRNKILSVNVPKCDYIFQTCWSDFMHVTALNKNKIYPLDEIIQEKAKDFDYTDYNNDNYTVFQNEDLFMDYADKFDIEGIAKTIEIAEDPEHIYIKTNKSFDTNNNLALITRIPQEFNLDLTTSGGNIKIVNSGDSKLIADKQIKIEYLNNSNNFYNADSKNFSLFEAKRLRTENFYLNSKDTPLSINIRSYLEVNKLFLSILNSSEVKIKKLGIVHEGVFNLNNSNIKIDSIYGPTLNDKVIQFNIKNSKLVIGSLQGNVSIIMKDQCKVIIDNMECNKFLLSTKEDDLNSEVEIFINNVKTSCILNGNRLKVILYLNTDSKERIIIKHKEEIIYTQTAREDNNKYIEDKVIEVNCENAPEIIEINSWDYMKKKLLQMKNKWKKNKL